MDTYYRASRLLLLLLALVVDHNSCNAEVFRITRSPVPVVARSREPVEMTCVLEYSTDFAPSGVHFIHNPSFKIPDKLTDSRRYFSSKTTNMGSREEITATLYITNALTSDSGSYHCYAFFFWDKTVNDTSEAASLTVEETIQTGLVVDGIPKDTGSMRASELSTGIRTLELHCQSFTDKRCNKLLWFKRNIINDLIPVAKSSSPVTTLESSETSNVIQISNPSPALTGSYECHCDTGDEEHPRVILTGSPIVLWEPPILSDRETQISIAMVGGDLIFRCQPKYYGYPTSNITWIFTFINGTKEVANKSPSYDVSEDKQVVKVVDIKEEQQGTMSCEVSNGFVTLTKVYNVKVTGKYAALVPFAGLVLNAGVLLVCIFTYENHVKRRMAAEM